MSLKQKLEKELKIFSTTCEKQGLKASVKFLDEFNMIVARIFDPQSGGAIKIEEYFDSCQTYSDIPTNISQPILKQMIIKTWLMRKILTDYNVWKKDKWVLCTAFEYIVSSDNMIYVGDSFRRILITLKTLLNIGAHVAYNNSKSPYYLIKRQKVTGKVASNFVKFYGENFKKLLRSNSSFRNRIRGFLLTRNIRFWRPLCDALPEETLLYFKMVCDKELDEKELKTVKKVLTDDEEYDQETLYNSLFQYLKDHENETLKEILLEYVERKLNENHSKILQKIDMLAKHELINRKIAEKFLKKLFYNGDVNVLDIRLEKKHNILFSYVITAQTGQKIYLIFERKPFSNEVKIMDRHPLLGEYGIIITITTLDEIKKRTLKTLHKCVSNSMEYITKIRRMTNMFLSNVPSEFIKMLYISKSGIDVKPSTIKVIIDAERLSSSLRNLEQELRKALKDFTSRLNEKDVMLKNLK